MSKHGSWQSMTHVKAWLTTRHGSCQGMAHDETLFFFTRRYLQPAYTSVRERWNYRFTWKGKWLQSKQNHQVKKLLKRRWTNFAKLATMRLRFCQCFRGGIEYIRGIYQWQFLVFFWFIKKCNYNPLQPGEGGSSMFVAFHGSVWWVYFA